MGTSSILWLVKTMAKTYSKDPDKKVWLKWRELVNITPSELKNFLASDMSRMLVTFNRRESDKKRMNTASQNAKWILRMLSNSHNFRSAVRHWTPHMWMWARRQVANITRLRRSGGLLRDHEGKPTKKLLFLLMWGHNPDKPLRKVRKSMEIVHSISEINKGLLDQLFILKSGKPYLVKDTIFLDDAILNIDDKFALVTSQQKDSFRSSTETYAIKRLKTESLTDGFLGKAVNVIDGNIVYKTIAVMNNDELHNQDTSELNIEIDAEEPDEYTDTEKSETKETTQSLCVPNPIFNIEMLKMGRLTGILTKENKDSIAGEDICLAAKQLDKYVIFGITSLEKGQVIESFDKIPSYINAGIDELSKIEFENENNFYFYPLNLVKLFDEPVILDSKATEDSKKEFNFV